MIGIEKVVAKVSLLPPKILLLETASPSSESSWTGLLRDIACLELAGLINPIRVLLTHVSGFNHTSSLFDKGLEIVKAIGFSEIWKRSHTKQNGSTFVGQLQCKLEAAGKVRVFAMVDV